MRLDGTLEVASLPLRRYIITRCYMFFPVLIAAGPPDWLLWIVGPIIIIVASVPFIGLGWLILKLHRGFQNKALAAIQCTYQGIQPRSEPVAGDVKLVYHTYHGFLHSLTETEHRVALPPDQARILLGRLFRFNLRWGCIAFGGPIVCAWAFGNYLLQRRSIRKQEDAAIHDAIYSVKPIDRDSWRDMP